jgi:nicotinamidase-related amidase
MTREWNEETQLHEVIAPLIDALLAACEAHGMPVAVAVQYSEREESSGLHLSYDIRTAESGGFMSWLAAVLEAAGKNEPIPLPVLRAEDESGFVNILRELGVTPADIASAGFAEAVAQAQIPGIVERVNAASHTND